MSKLIIYGPGRLGTTLGVAFQCAGHELLCGVSHTPQSESSQRFQRLTNIPVCEHEEATSLLPLADVVFLAVPDQAVSKIAQTLAEAKALGTGQVVVHTAGSLASSVLAPIQRQGVSTASAHPLQTFADPLLGAQHLQGVYFSLEGEKLAVATASRLVRDLGAIPVPIEAAMRPRYHAAAVLASNALVTLASVAVDLLALPQGLDALLPLLQGTLDNLAAVGLPRALTGPVDRGDQTTIHAHLHALQDNPTALHVYTALGQATVEVANRKGSLTETEQQILLNLFRNRTNV